MFDLRIIQAVNRPFPDKSGVVGYHRRATFERSLRDWRDSTGAPVRPLEAAQLAEKRLNRRAALLAGAAGGASDPTFVAFCKAVISETLNPEVR